MRRQPTPRPLAAPAPRPGGFTLVELVIVIVLAALVVATTSKDALVLLGGLAVAYGFQMWPALIAVCWWPWLTRQGITW